MPDDVSYPGRVIKLGETNRATLRAIVGALREFGYEIEKIPPSFDSELSATVKLFQSQHSDTLGRPLKIDGQVGPLTWTALFGAPPAPAAPASPPCLTSTRLAREDAIANPSLILPGMVFIHDYGEGRGHTGFVRATAGGALKTIEGNADPQGGRNGLAVIEVNKRNVMDRSLKGFIRL